MKHVGKDSNLERNAQNIKHVSSLFTGLNSPFFDTISGALSNAVTGDLIYVHPGKYNERITLVTDVNLFLESGAIINPSLDSSTSIITASSVKSTIYGNGEISYTGGLYTPRLITISGTSDVTIKMKNIKGKHSAGILIQDNAKATIDVESTDNIIEVSSTSPVLVKGDFINTLSVTNTLSSVTVNCTTFNSISQTAGKLKVFFSEFDGLSSVGQVVQVTGGYCELIDGKINCLPGIASSPVRASTSSAKIRLKHVEIANRNPYACIYLAGGTIITDNVSMDTDYAFSVDWNGTGIFKNWGSVANKPVNPAITQLVQTVLIDANVE